MKQYLRLIYIFTFTITTTTQPVFVDFLLGMYMLDQFNAANRRALYNSLAGNQEGEEDDDEGKGKPSGLNDFFNNIREEQDMEKQVRAVSQSSYTFKDLAGDIPEDIREIADVIRDPLPFQRVGAHIPKGILLYGPPGTGKTSIARAIAGEAAADFFQASGSEFIELYVGVGPKRVRELFTEARKHKKAIIFIDEIDAIGTKRTGETNSEYRNTLNALLNEMDGFTGNNITVIAATNRIDDLDSALLRPGRFDRLVEIPLPNQQSRADIFRLYCSKIAYYGPSTIYVELAQKSFGFSGADIKNVVNEAAVFAARQHSNEVLEEHLYKSLDKILQQKRKTKK